MANPKDHQTPSRVDPNLARPPESPRRPGHKLPEPNPNPQRPGDDARDVGLVGGASPTAPAKTIDPRAQRAAEERIRKETDPG